MEKFEEQVEQVLGVIYQTVEQLDRKFTELFNSISPSVYGCKRNLVEIELQNIICTKHRLNCYRENIVGILSSRLVGTEEAIKGSKEIVDSTNGHMEMEHAYLSEVLQTFSDAKKRKSKTVKKNKRR